MLFPTIYQTLGIPKYYMTYCRSRPKFTTPLRSWATWYTSIDEDGYEDTVACSHARARVTHIYYSVFQGRPKTYHSVIRYGNKKLSWG